MISQIVLFILIYHIFVLAAALLVDEFIKNGRPIIVLGFLLALTSCSTPPIKVTPMVDVKAVTTQNETTKKHIKTFSEHGSKTKEKIDKATEAHKAEEDKLKSVLNDLDRLLKR